MAAAALPLVAACTAEDAASTPDHWAVVAAYDEATRAHWAKQSEIRNAEIPAAEKERLQEDLGRGPDDLAAVAAAIAIVASNGQRLLDAADFLMNRVVPPDDAQRLILDALAGHFGPDWSLVEGYVESLDRLNGLSPE